MTCGEDGFTNSIFIIFFRFIICFYDLSKIQNLNYKESYF
ncbi:hypothetical protein LEP1GSC016_2981 [Leptospira borgpetersenii serovar Hardjo-bovis str. Sponselee]|uniref:Uncharacterized protein n=3 Tax=Leptospira borgpetersenii TaxID=174 RepID=M3HMJ1_LEPBO|nr:hypothetical protein LEP1GSC101_3143 [Leptospira borgpetersenii str. UI 09149]EMF99300.1 hypothetical protein LEP1GSC123_4634 [Leptospira borgpetersenii str. 200701203]EMJ80112.1 hypothetical protein LEP1GSC016_2981 [Leptospira borgpetersenii serovar Hardjo-bovis str. Sponselee]EMN19373.1 hypothetical protein LEP1GSC056_3063 [Leptospira borgpetersenii str. Brem 328]EMN59340.1 hypothetical protein LEP1GSC090_1455 [Leptospira borgpetersenii serovar Javanica str. MK146]ENO65588.1 hypothetical 